MEQFDLKKHCKESEAVILKSQKVLDRYATVMMITKKLRLKRINNYYAKKANELAFACLKLTLANYDLLLPIATGKWRSN